MKKIILLIVIISLLTLTYFIKPKEKEEKYEITKDNNGTQLILIYN